MQVHPRADNRQMKHEFINVTLLLTSLALWLLIALGDVLPGSLPNLVIFDAVILIAIMGICFILKARSLNAACFLFLCSVNLAAAQMAQSAAFTPALYLIPTTLIIAVIVLSAPWIAAALLLDALLIALAAPAHDAPPLLFLLLAHVIVIGLLKRYFRRELEMSQGFQDYAAEQMREARESRAALVLMSKQLQEYQERLRVTNQKLEVAFELAEESREMKARFAANVSHELRTPINLIVGFSEVMIEAPEVYEEPLPATYADDIRAIFRNARHLQHLINDVLDISQLEARHLAIVKQKGSLGDCVRDSAAMVADLVAKKGLDFRLEIADDLPELLFDPVRIRQILLNLLVNAARFTRQGGITVRVSADDRSVTTSVIDTGIGLSNADISQIFDEFYQVDAAAGATDRGTGLGLTLSRELIRLHDGEMSVSSAGAGQGSRFDFSLPTTSKLVAQMPTENRASQPERVAKRVLVVDEDEAITGFFERYLKSHQVAASHSEADAMRAIDDFAPDALLLSQDQPYRKLRQRIKDQKRGLSLITMPMPSGRAAIRQRGISEYLVKPVSREILVKTLERFGDGARSIMIIDDNRDIVRLFSQTLRSLDAGYTIRAAYSGVAGLDMMQRQPPDLLLLDVLMPGLDGFAVLQRMRSLPRLRDLPVILISAKGASESITPNIQGDISLTRANGFTPIELMSSVQSLIDSIQPGMDITLEKR